MEEITTPFGDEATLTRLTRDLKKAGVTLGRDEARFLVDAYYRMQEQRIRFKAQIRQMTDVEEPHVLLDWFGNQSGHLENQVKAALDVYSMSEPVGQWMRGIIGIGPVIAAGMLAHIDIERIEYAGQLWSYAGLNPGVKWSKGQKRPWNAELKTLCYKVGESFVKVKNHPRDFYGRLFQQRKDWEWERNLKGEYAEQAQGVLESRAIGKTTAAHAWYSGMVDAKWAQGRLTDKKTFPQTASGFPKDVDGVPMLPPAHIHARARRWAVKLFLSHLFEVMYLENRGEAPTQPFVLTMDKHNRKIEPPALVVDDI